MIIIIIMVIILMIRQEAVDYMEANTALSRVAVEREVKHYFDFFCIFEYFLIF